MYEMRCTRDVLYVRCVRCVYDVRCAIIILVHSCVTCAGTRYVDLVGFFWCVRVLCA